MSPLQRRVLASIAAAALGGTVFGDVVTYVDHVRPILAARCLQCHNSDKAKGDLDLSTYAALMQGSSGGRVAVAGDPAGSSLVGAVEHTREPYMPPKSSKLPDADLATIRAWVAGGCLETATSAASAPTPAVVLIAAAPAVEGAPLDVAALRLPMETRPPRSRAPVAYALAAHSSAPLLATVAGRQILLHDLASGGLIGAFDGGDDDIVTARFSRDGRFLVAGCGFAAARGSVRIWSIADGEEIARAGDETDVALAADVDTLRSRVALGGPGRVVKIFALGAAAPVARLTKHTDWITALAYSPDGALLASADRAGGIHLWEAASLAPYLALEPHAGRVTALEWSADGNVLASAAEDGKVRLHDVNDGRALREWDAHPGGVTAMTLTRDGLLATGGRDRFVRLWNPDGSRAVEGPAFEAIVVAIAASAGNAEIVASDLDGRVRRLRRTDLAVIGAFDTNPAPIAERLTTAEAAGDVAAVHRLRGGVLRADLDRAREEMRRAEDAARPAVKARASAAAAREDAERAHAEATARLGAMPGLFAEASSRVEELNEAATRAANEATAAAARKSARDGDRAALALAAERLRAAANEPTADEPLREAAAKADEALAAADRAVAAATEKANGARAAADAARAAAAGAAGDLVAFDAERAALPASIAALASRMVEAFEAEREAVARAEDALAPVRVAEERVLGLERLYLAHVAGPAISAGASAPAAVAETPSGS